MEEMRRKELEFRMIGRALTPSGKDMQSGDREMLDYFGHMIDGKKKPDDKKNKWKKLGKMIFIV